MTSLFSLEAYYLRLQTKKLGRPCLYLDLVDSTINVAEKEKYNTLVLAKEQTHGRGQRDNKWLSPAGCAMASIRLECPHNSLLSERLCFLQHILAVSAARTLEKIDPHLLGRDYIAFKWPNDIIYKKTSQKIGGILVKTYSQTNFHDVILSFGLNVRNREPTICIDQILENNYGINYRERPAITIDSVVADLLNNLEYNTYELTDEKFKLIKADYESRCLQIGKVVLDAEHGTVLVKGVNNEGYLIGEDSMTGKPRVVTRII